MTERPFDKQALQQEYDRLRPKYEKLEASLRRDLYDTLHEAGINVLSIESRVKEFDSFWGKVQRKRYDNPLEDIHDMCGLRVICYYPGDVEPVCQVMGNDLDVIELLDKADSLE
ncbi:MAG: RelA/SpoT domain-containing protein, partial [Anaerolineae bacterium]|nr:RelA/SpoT domain-containing protein [Anaerolineae bacterium]